MVDGLVRDAEPVSAVGGIAEIFAGFQRKVFDLRLIARISDGRDHEHSHRAVRHEIFIDRGCLFSRSSEGAKYIPLLRSSSGFN